MLGFYHSHPSSPARPSETDFKAAWPLYLYLILEMRGGTPGELRAWRLNADGSRFDQAELTLHE